MGKADEVRVDQDINFSIGGIPVIMKLDTASPFDLWHIYPKRQEDKGGAFKEAVAALSEILPLCALNESAVSIEREDSATVHWITASLPDWDGRGLDGLVGASDLAGFLADLATSPMVEGFQTSDGSEIDYKPFLRP